VPPEIFDQLLAALTHHFGLPRRLAVLRCDACGFEVHALSDDDVTKRVCWACDLTSLHIDRHEFFPPLIYFDQEFPVAA
jgi:hypothetical protein